MQQRLIGDVKVGAIGFGAAHLSVPDAIDETQAIRTIHAALDAGVTFIDTAYAYVPWGAEGHNEALVAKGLATCSGDSSGVLVGTKGGHYRGGERSWDVDGRPETIKRHCKESLRALDVETIGLYTLHLPDESVPLVESMGAFKDLQEEGAIRLVGVSNFSVEQIEEARAVVDVVAVQNRYSPLAADSTEELQYCAREGIAFTPYGVLGGRSRAAELNTLAPVFGEIAGARGVSAQQVTLAWALAQASAVIPLCGARRPATIEDSIRAAELILSDEELNRLDTAVPAA